jgi:hypothetical protein
MGRELTCKAMYNRQQSEGKALLETDAILFCGEFRVALPFAAITSVQTKAGRLSLRSAAGTLILLLGDQAETWARKITNPPTLLDKLGVKAGMRVSVVGISNRTFIDELRSRAAVVSVGRLARDVDMVVLGLETADDLRRLPAAVTSIARGGAIWTVRPKGHATLSEVAVMKAGKNAGLVDVKVARFSDTHTAEKFVIPVARR